ncbi:Small G protein signaling modulator 2 RUN and TBC1 domain-containing protein 1 [Triplophysa tibetana]|uniref:Small G protein signaling modulator 2 RUN and TBC1 domain-containing protein 1 n=1 Tax=Triplophysa tibetana TaxID=1572043 RepID=A0A5A9MY92_9TELE|nr:Small G protein signaling modulator 2 RUN and TBC1 domain-containing protein 1 [Triplophysa tibetana]
MSSTTNEEFKEKLLWTVKREVKQIMEEAVTKKFVHEDSSHIIALCTSLTMKHLVNESCLRRRFKLDYKQILFVKRAAVRSDVAKKNVE